MMQDAMAELLVDLETKHPEVYNSLMNNLADRIQVAILRRELGLMKNSRGGDSK
jgi:hypothetical protein